MPEFPDRTPLEFAADRECNLPDLGPTLQAAWQRSRETLTQMNELFASTPLPSSVQTIYVCGSIGRMEQLPNSDCDLVIVTDDLVSPKSDEARQIHTAVWQQLQPLGMTRPKPDGIFSETVTWGQLTDRSTRGLVDEDQFVYGKRMQMLLDSQPVAHAEQFRELQFDGLKRFHRPLVNDPDVCDWTPLINEVLRYWKALEVRTTWIGDPGKWRYLNVKLRHSRRLMIVGLLMALCNEECLALETRSDGQTPVDSSSRRSGRIAGVQSNLKQTPCERVFPLPVDDDDALETFSNCYNSYLKRMADEEFVNRLRDPAIEELNTPEYLELSENATRFSCVINRVLKAQAEKCTPHVRQALMLP